MVHLILASQSPRRRELLSLCGYPFQVLAAAVDETSVDIPDPSTNTIRTARLKAEVIANRLPRSGGQRVIIIAADTIVALENQMLGKPADSAEARRMLRALRGREHKVYTGMVLLDLGTEAEVTAVHAASVQMRPYTNQEIERYVASGDPLDKAGAYAIQHPQFKPVAALDGCLFRRYGIQRVPISITIKQIRSPHLSRYDGLERGPQPYFLPPLGGIKPPGIKNSIRCHPCTS